MMGFDLREFIVQEVRACESADPEMLTIFGREFLSIVDWFHPKLDAIRGLCISQMEDGSKLTVLICRPVLEYEPTIMHFWEGEKMSEDRAVYFCPNALLVIRPTEKGDEAFIEATKEKQHEL